MKIKKRVVWQTLPENSESQYVMCGYRLENTLSDHGHVSRGICQVDPGGMLKTVQEYTAIEQDQDGRIVSQGKPVNLRPDDLVSMNFWGFTPDIFRHLDQKMHAFLAENIENPKAEFYIPFVVDELIRDGKARVKVLKTQAKWFGVTYKEDREKAVEAIQDMVDRNVYPAKLF